jgi:hypothetical protein
MTALVPGECGGIAVFIPHTPFKRLCSQCGGAATCMCDYRPGGHGLPCDLLLCDGCKSEGVAPGRHHCVAHAKVWGDRQDLRAAARGKAA